jgi:hypothetical protein
VAYNVNDRRCWQKMGNSSAADIEESANTIMAFTDPEIWESRSKDCPFANNTIQTDDNGLSYHVLCGSRQQGDNFDPTIRPAYQPFHADTILECMNYCSAGDPFCNGILYSEGFDIGYHNCWAKAENYTEGSVVPDEGATTAYALRPAVNSSCSSTQYSVASDATFNVTCDMSATGPNIETQHAANLEECLSLCADFQPETGNSRCNVVAYNPDSSAGWLNCYLKDAYRESSNEAGWHMAVLAATSADDIVSDEPSTGTPGGSGDGTAGGDSGDNDSSSSAWIAGAVVGPVAGLAMIGGLVFWWRRRKRAGGDASSVEKTEMDPLAQNSANPGGASTRGSVMKHEYYTAGSPVPPPPFSPGQHAAVPPGSAHGPSPPPAELGTDARDARELPASTARFELQ